MARPSHASRDRTEVTGGSAARRRVVTTTRESPRRLRARWHPQALKLFDTVLELLSQLATRPELALGLQRGELGLELADEGLEGFDSFAICWHVLVITPSWARPIQFELRRSPPRSSPTSTSSRRQGSRPRRFDARKLATDLCLFLRTVGCDSAIEPGARCSRYVPRDAHDPASGRAPPRTGKTTRIPSYGLRSRKQHAARVRPQDRVLGWVVRRLLDDGQVSQRDH